MEEISIKKRLKLLMHIRKALEGCICLPEADKEFILWLIEKEEKQIRQLRPQEQNIETSVG